MRLAAVLSTVIACAPAAVHAQVPGLAPGDTIRYASLVPAAPRPPAETGQLERPRITDWRVVTVARVTTDSLLMLAPRTRAPLAIHLDSIYALDVSRGRLPRMRRLKTWGTIGLMTGLLAGALTADQDITSVMAHLGVGAAAGLAAGVAITISRPGPRNWVELRIPCRPQPGAPCPAVSAAAWPRR